MKFKDKAYYVNKIKCYLGLTLAAVIFDAMIMLCLIFA